MVLNTKSRWLYLSNVWYRLNLWQSSTCIDLKFARQKLTWRYIVSIFGKIISFAIFLNFRKELFSLEGTVECKGLHSTILKMATILLARESIILPHRCFSGDVKSIRFNVKPQAFYVQRFIKVVDTCLHYTTTLCCDNYTLLFAGTRFPRVETAVHTFVDLQEALSCSTITFDSCADFRTPVTAKFRRF